MCQTTDRLCAAKQISRVCNHGRTHMQVTHGCTQKNELPWKSLQFWKYASTCCRHSFLPHAVTAVRGA